MYESGEIIKYLFENYSDGQTKPPWGLMLGPLTAISCTLGMLPRVSLQPQTNALLSDSCSAPVGLWAGPAALGTLSEFTKLLAAPRKWDCSPGPVLGPLNYIIGPAALGTPS